MSAVSTPHDLNQTLELRNKDDLILQAVAISAWFPVLVAYTAFLCTKLQVYACKDYILCAEKFLTQYVA